MLKQISPSRLLQIDARRICLIKPSALGDVVQTLPLLPVLRQRFPRARISWVVSAPLASLLEGHPSLDEIIPFHRKGAASTGLELLCELRQREFDLVFDLQGLLRTGVMTAATGAPVRVGLESAREGAGLACNCVLPESGRRVPAHRRYWRVAEALGLGDREPRTEIALADEDQAWAAEALAGLGRPVLAIHAGARWITKRWPVEKFAAVAAKAARRFGGAAVLVGSPDEQATSAQPEQVLRRLAPAASLRNLTGRSTLKQLAAVLQRADLLLANDSGPMHLAAGLGRPVVGIFTCTSPVRSGPPGLQHELPATGLACGGSYRKRCPYRGRKHLACMDELATERVWQAVARSMERVVNSAGAA
jgi:lipopolysaccharide heptosyltransferase II